MTLPLNLSPAVKIAKSTATRSVLDADTLPGKLLLFAAPRVAEGATPAAAELVGVPLTKPSGSVDGAGFAITASAPGQVATSGTITWGRFVDGAGNWVIDADAGIAAVSPAVSPPIILDTATVYAGGFVTLVSALLAEGG